MINVSTVVSSMQKELWAFFGTEAHPNMYGYITSAVNYIYNRWDWQWNRVQYSLSYSSTWVEETLPFFAQKVYRVKKNGEEQAVYTREDWFMADTHEGAVGIFGDIFVSDSPGTYQILYAATAPSVSAADITINIPPFFVDALQIIAIHYAYKDTKDYQTSGTMIAQANAILDSVTERTVDVRPRQVTRFWSNHSF